MVLTPSLASLSIDSMAKSEVIEYTDDFMAGETSTSIKQVWHNANTETMTVSFKTGGLYSYFGVPVSLFTTFRESESLGQFFHGTFRKVGDEPWPGTKHDLRTTKFQKVEVAEAIPSPDPDVFKSEKLTYGSGKNFLLDFEYTAKGQMEVRAADVDDAISKFVAFAWERGFDVKVKRVTIDLT